MFLKHIKQKSVPMVTGCGDDRGRDKEEHLRGCQLVTMVEFLDWVCVRRGIMTTL